MFSNPASSRWAHYSRPRGHIAAQSVGCTRPQATCRRERFAIIASARRRRGPIFSHRGTDELGQAGCSRLRRTGQGRDLTIPPDQRRVSGIGSTRNIVRLSAGDGLLLYDFDNGRAANDGFGLPADATSG
jgi:hypothetical protein